MKTPNTDIVEARVSMALERAADGMLEEAEHLRLLDSVSRVKGSLVRKDKNALAVADEIEKASDWVRRLVIDGKLPTLGEDR